jgi:hypothetical protein
MRLATILHAIGLAPPPSPKEIDDQVYSEAVMENAVRESDKRIKDLAVVAENGAASNARLSESIERLQIGSANKNDVMAELVRGMKSRQGVI